MARDLRLSITADSSSADKAFASATAALEKAQRELKGAEARTESLAVKARRLAEAEERAADKTRDLATKAAALRQQIKESGDETGQLGRKLDRLSRDTRHAALATDDYRRSADRAASEAREQARAYDRVAANANQAARAVARLGAVSALSPDGNTGRSGRGGGFAASLAGLLPDFASDLLGTGTKAGGAAAGAAGSAASAGPYGIAAGVGLGALGALALGPLVGGAVGGATLLGGASAGAGLGLAGAWMGDPAKYGYKWDTMIDRLQKRWIDSSAQFGKPLEDSLKEVDRIFRDLPVERLADASKDFVAPLVQGAGGGITAAADGFADFVKAAQPVVDTIGPQLADLGHDIGDSLRAIGLGSKGGAEALGDLVDGIGFTIRAAGVLVLGLEAAYSAERDLITGTYDFATSLPGTGKLFEYAGDKIFRISSTSISAGRSLQGMADDADTAGQAVQGLSADLDELRTNQLRAANANLALAQGWIDLKEELNEGRKTLDLNTQAGIDNTKAIESQVETANAAREKQIQLTGDIDAANATYAANVERIRQMAYAAGFNKQQVDALIASIAAIPPAKSTEIQLKGISAALSNVSAMAQALARIQGTYIAHLRVEGSLRDAPEHRARGGTLPSSGFRVAGEHGPEMFWGDRGEYVSTADQTRQLLSMMGSGAGGTSSGGPLTMQVAPGADSLFGQMMQYALDRGWVQIFAGQTQVTTRRV